MMMTCKLVQEASSGGVVVSHWVRNLIVEVSTS
jgi:hypothetical protein